MKVFVIQTGVANTAAVMTGLRRVGAKPELTADADVVRDAHRVVLPGVGAFGAGMTALRGAGLADAITERVYG